MEGSILLQAKENTLRAVCHEVVAIGPDVLDTWVGDQVLHISTAADAADYDKFEKNEAKYVFVREDDLVGGWDFDEAVEVVKSIPGNEKTGQ